MARVLIVALLLFASQWTWAQNQHSLIRKLAVFPLKVPAELNEAGEEAWWQIREALTENKRFLVASRNFLVQKDVLQARAELTPADGIILGKLLDANALVVTFLSDRTLKMKVYEGEYGRMLWEHEVILQASLPLSQQLATASKKLIYDFIASIPYQGYAVLDNLKGKVAYNEAKKLLVKVNIGTGSQINVGDPIQFVQVHSDSLKPVFISGATIEVFAEGVVVESSREIVTVEIIKVTKSEDIQEYSLVRVPKEFKRIQDSFALQDRLKAKIDPGYFSPEITPVQEEVQEKKPLVASLSFILNLAAFLLLAF